MQYVNLNLADLRSETYLGCEPVDRATWINMITYCVMQENGGVIKHCADWGDRKWQQIVGITLAEAQRVSPLWTWDGDDIIVWKYPKDQENLLQTRRTSGREAAERRWAKDRSPNGSPNGSPITDENRSPIESPTTAPNGSPNTKRKEKKRKEIDSSNQYLVPTRTGENENETPPDSLLPNGNENDSAEPIHDRDEVIAYAESIGLPHSEAVKFFEWGERLGWVSQSGFPVNWKQSAVSWRTRCQKQPKTPKPQPPQDTRLTKEELAEMLRRAG